MGWIDGCTAGTPKCHLPYMAGTPKCHLPYMAGTPKCAVNPSLPSEQLGVEDWWDVSQVDGWTLPYKVSVR